jgi:MFS transporter, DHA2 family, multidrug resistance protein
VSTDVTRRRATIALMIASAMQAADATIVNVALPPLETSFGGGVELGALVMTSYLCATAVMAPLTGLLRRRYGAQQLFPAGIGVFVAASLLCAGAPSAAALIVFRILQGAAGGLLLPLAQAILLDIHPQERHGRMLAAWGATVMVGPILGPALGGVITDLASWRWVFVVNLPVGVAAIWGMRGVLPRFEGRRDVGVDAFSVILLIVGVGALQLCLLRAVGRSWVTSPELPGEALTALLAFAVVTIRARTADFRVIRPDVFADVNFAAAAFFNFMTSALLFTTIVFVPALAEGTLGYNATIAGLTIVPRGILMLLMMLVVGQLIEKVGYRVLLLCGLVFTMAGLTVLSEVEPAGAITWMVAGSTLQALGAGMLFTPLSALAFASLPMEVRTDAAGLYSLSRQLGCASGVALMNAVLRTNVAGNLAASAATPGGTLPFAALAPIAAATLQAYAQCFHAMAIAVLAIAPGIVLFRYVRPRRTAPEVI